MDTLEHVARALIDARLDVRRDHPVGSLTTYGVGGTCAVAVVAADIADVARAAPVLAAFPDVPVAVLGRGSNTLVADGCFGGVVLVVKSAPADVDVEVQAETVRAPGSMSMPVLARRALSHGRGGLEWCVGIPGSVGGAVRMNAGGHGAEMVDSLTTASVVSLRSGLQREVDAVDLGLHFRGSALSGHHVVVGASFRTSSIEPSVGQQMIDEVVAWRRKNQPGGRNAGSVFVNPAPGQSSAGALIDAAGMRGQGNEGARVSDKHANFIQAAPGGRAADIIEVMTLVQRVVHDRHGVTLRSEVCLVGFDDGVMERFADPRHESPERAGVRSRLAALMGETP